MKFVKSISLFFLYPMAMLGVGFYFGVVSSHFFYPNGQAPQGDPYEESAEDQMMESPEAVPDEMLDYKARSASHEDADMTDPGQESSLEASTPSDTLTADTKYVLEETNILDQSVVETTWRLPAQYIGMDRRRFLEVMEQYEASPPLSEKERGFVGLEVLSFSRERVVVQMNYRYVQPSASFYLAVYNNEVVVYLEDKKTIYINTDIPLSSLPEKVQQDIIQMMWVPDEESLYHLLESYSS